jgi:hypothetical protein
LKSLSLTLSCRWSPGVDVERSSRAAGAEVGVGGKLPRCTPGSRPASPKHSGAALDGQSAISALDEADVSWIDEG